MVRMSFLLSARGVVVLLFSYAVAACGGPPMQGASVRSNTLITASAGPVASGPILAHRAVGLEGSVTTVATGASEQSTSGGAASAIHTLVRGRVSVGVLHGAELGLHLEVADSRWRRSTLEGEAPTGPEERVLVQGGLQVRVPIVGTESLGLRMSGEIALTQLPYNVDVSEYASGFGGAVATRYTVREVVVRPSLLVGLYGVVAPTRGLQLAAGIGAGAEPVPRASFQANWVVGDNDERKDVLVPFTTAPFVTAFGWGAYTVGSVTFIAQIAGGTRVSSPFGGTLAFRVAL
jgi:hypothetical protein